MVRASGRGLRFETGRRAGRGLGRGILGRIRHGIGLLSGRAIIWQFSAFPARLRRRIFLLSVRNGLRQGIRLSTRIADGQGRQTMGEGT